MIIQFSKKIALGSALLFSTVSFADMVANPQDFADYSFLERINTGVAKGDLTQDEGKALLTELGDVKLAYETAKEDGNINKAERALLKPKMDALSQHIFQSRHDGESRQANQKAKDAADKAEKAAQAANFSAQAIASDAGRDLSQANRIDAGVASGVITEKEGNKLAAEQAKIDIIQEGIVADGVVNKKEAGFLAKYRNKANKNISAASKVKTNGDRQAQTKPAGRTEETRNNNAVLNAGSKKKAATMAQRINAGIKDGSLTKEEAGQLKAGMNEIKNFKAGANADGSLNKAEREAFNKLKKEQSSQIYQERHDQQVAAQQ